jgi:hypothetical protein
VLEGRVEPSETVLLTNTRLKEKLAKLEEEVKRLAAIEKALLASPDKQISLTDPDCRSMATSGRGSGMVAYNVQSAGNTLPRPALRLSALAPETPNSAFPGAPRPGPIRCGVASSPAPRLAPRRRGLLHPSVATKPM